MTLFSCLEIFYKLLLWKYSSIFPKVFLWDINNFSKKKCFMLLYLGNTNLILTDFISITHHMLLLLKISKEFGFFQIYLNTNSFFMGHSRGLLLIVPRLLRDYYLGYIWHSFSYLTPRMNLLEFLLIRSFLVANSVSFLRNYFTFILERHIFVYM